MTRALSTALALMLLVATAIPVAADEAPTDSIAVTPPGAEVVPGEVVVKWRDPSLAPAAAEAHDLTVLGDVDTGASAETGEVVSTEGRPVDEVLAELRADPAVEIAEPNFIVHLTTEPGATAVAVNDPKTGPQYSLDRMRVRDAWAHTTGSFGKVAVLDTGVDFGHPDLASRIVAGHDFVNNDADARDDNGHGTWVAGIIGANANDGFGIAGISWLDKIMPVKIMNANGTGDTSDLTSGIVWAANNGATVINMSVGGFPYSTFVHDAVRYAWSKGVVLVGAAGNNATNGPFYPASYPEVVSVSATQTDDEFTFWSNYGADVDVSAPGASVLTTNCQACKPIEQDLSGDHRFTYISGTSFAAPNVSGVVALIRAAFPSMTNAQVVERLKATVDDMGTAGWDIRYGHGRVNALRAVGGTPAAIPLSGADAMEGNNTLSTARLVGLGLVRPNIYPAGDVDVFAVDAPRAGRMEISVAPVLDARAWPWNRSALPVDTVLNVYHGDGRHITTVDGADPAATDRAHVTVTAPERLLVRVHNYTPNGSRATYRLTTAFVDNFAPTASLSPARNATQVDTDGTAVTATFDEAVQGVSSSTFRLLLNGSPVPASVSYDPATRRAILRPSAELLPEQAYQAQLSGGAILDDGGLSFAGTAWSFTTGKAAPRIAGATRYATAASVSAATFASGVPVAFVATGTTFPDALAGAPAARTGGGPLLLVEPNAVPSATATELSRLQPGRIVVLGGPDAVSGAVMSALDAFTAGAVTRLAGADRYATAAAISAATFAPGASIVFVATGRTFPDSLTAGAEAARRQAPILLVGPGEIPAATAAELSRLRPGHIIVVGGSAVVSDAVVAGLRSFAPTVDRVAGPDRYATATALSRSFYAPNTVDTVYLATGTAFPDGLAVGPVAGLVGVPLLLVHPSRVPAPLADELRRLDPTTIVFIGGPGAISDATRAAVRGLWR